MTQGHKALLLKLISVNYGDKLKCTIIFNLLQQHIALQLPKSEIILVSVEKRINDERFVYLLKLCVDIKRYC